MGGVPEHIEESNMKYSILIAASLTMCALSGCDRPVEVVQSPSGSAAPPTTVVVERHDHDREVPVPVVVPERDHHDEHDTRVDVEHRKDDTRVDVVPGK